MMPEQANHMLFPLFRLSRARQQELEKVTRSFLLGKGEELTLRTFAPNDYLYVAHGTVTVALPDGSEQRLDSATSRTRPFLVPAEIDTLAVRAEEEALLYHIDREKLDFLVFWDGLRSALDPASRELQRRMEKIHNALAFRHLPSENLHEAVHRMQLREVAAGEVIIRQGEKGDAFYMIDRGRAEVWQQGLYDEEPQRIAMLFAGDTFGEEALVTGGMRTATVTMAEAGELLVLSKRDFEELVSRSMIREVDAPTARSLMASGYQLLDVRYPEEYDERHIRGARLVPLHEVRNHLQQVDPAGKYLVCCRSGKRSAVAALLLSQRGIEAVSLKGGLRDWPYETESAF